MNPAIIKIILAIVQAIAAALAASRNDPQKVAQIKADTDKKFNELEGALKEEDKEQISDLRSQFESVVTTALAARPPTPEQIAEVENIKPMEDFVKERDARENVVIHKPQ